jgi:hypothetical protein
VAFEGDVVLTVKEKKALGLNSRMKYSKKFIEYFEPSVLKSIEPKATLELHAPRCVSSSVAKKGAS